MGLGGLRAVLLRLKMLVRFQSYPVFGMLGKVGYFANVKARQEWSVFKNHETVYKIYTSMIIL